MARSNVMTSPQKNINILVVVEFFAEFVVSNLLALLIVDLIGKVVVIEVRVPYIPANPLVFLVLFLVCSMLWKLVGSFKQSKRTFVAMVLAILVYSLIMYSVAVEKLIGVIFDTKVLFALTMLICLIALLPFLVEQTIIRFHGTTAKRDSVFFAATVMWLSPLIAELAILFKWYLYGNLWNRLSYMVLGGKGTSDVLFYYGFWAFVAVITFHFLARLSRMLIRKG